MPSPPSAAAHDDPGAHEDAPEEIDSADTCKNCVEYGQWSPAGRLVVPCANCAVEHGFVFHGRETFGMLSRQHELTVDDRLPFLCALCPSPGPAREAASLAAAARRIDAGVMLALPPRYHQLAREPGWAAPP